MFFPFPPNISAKKCTKDRFFSRVHKVPVPLCFLPEAQAKAIIEKVAQQKAEEAREAAAEKELKETEKKMWEAYDNGEVSTTDVDLVVDPETGELVAPEQQAVPEEKRERERRKKKRLLLSNKVTIRMT